MQSFTTVIASQNFKIFLDQMNCFKIFQIKKKKHTNFVILKVHFPLNSIVIRLVSLVSTQNVYF